MQEKKLTERTHSMDEFAKALGCSGEIRDIVSIYPPKDKFDESISEDEIIGIQITTLDKSSKTKKDKNKNKSDIHG